MIRVRLGGGVTGVSSAPSAVVGAASVVFAGGPSHQLRKGEPTAAMSLVWMHSTPRNLRNGKRRLCIDAAHRTEPGVCLSIDPGHRNPGNDKATYEQLVEPQGM